MTDEQCYHGNNTFIPPPKPSLLPFQVVRQPKGYGQRRHLPPAPPKSNTDIPAPRSGPSNSVHTNLRGNPLLRAPEHRRKKTNKMSAEKKATFPLVLNITYPKSSLGTHRTASLTPRKRVQPLHHLLPLPTAHTFSFSRPPTSTPVGRTPVRSSDGLYRACCQW
jgi:hypothetical protein